MSIIADKIEIKIDGKGYTIDEKNNNSNDYIFSDIQLSQDLRGPNKLHFFMQQKSEEALKTSIPSLYEKLIGKKVEFFLSTKRDSDLKEKEDILEFSGFIFNINVLRRSMGAESEIEVVAYSPDYLLYDNPHCYSYGDAVAGKKLKDIVTHILEKYENDIPVKNEPTMEDEIPYTVQYNETSYEFLDRLAARYGQWLFSNGKELVFGKLEKSNSLELKSGKDILNYKYLTNIEHQNFTHAHHNYLSFENTKNNALDLTGDDMHGITDNAYKQSKELYKKETFQHLKCSTAEESPFDEAELSAKIQGLGYKSQMMLCKVSSNRADLRIGSVINIKEESEKNGAKIASSNHDELLVCKITHFTNGSRNYENTFTAIPSACEIPPYSYGDHYPKAESQRAVVKDNQDPEKLGRVRVQFLWQLEQEDAKDFYTPWIRIAQPHGGDNKGFYFIPEIEEEVMVGFENGNAEKPYVIGTLYHGGEDDKKQRPGENWYNDSNDIKAIRTRNGHTIEFHDVDEGGFIKIYDNEKDNYILTFSTDDKLIKLESKGDIQMYAEGNITMKAKKSVNISAGGNINSSAGGDIKETADKNISIDAKENIKVNAGKDMETSVMNNSALNVQENYEVDIRGEKTENIMKNYTLGVDEDMKLVSKQKMQIGANDIEIKADSSMKLDGGNSMDVKASNIKLN